MTSRIRKPLLLVSMLGLVCLCAAQTVERVGAPNSETLGDATKLALESKGYRITLDGWSAEFWFARNPATTKKNVPGTLYPELSDGEFVGAVNFPKGFTDFRGQSLPAGVYTLRYQLLPQDGNHLGVAPNPDFLLAIPAAADSHPDQSCPYKKLVALSAKSTGGNHPAVIALDSPGEPGTITKTEQGGEIFSVAVPSATATEKLGIVIKGSASQ